MIIRCKFEVEYRCLLEPNNICHYFHIHPLKTEEGETSQAKSARRGPPEGWECQVYRAYTSIRLVRHILIYIMSEVVGFYVKNL